MQPFTPGRLKPFRVRPVPRSSHAFGAAVAVALAVLATACTSPDPSAAAPATATTALCVSPSRVSEGGDNGTEVEGSSQDGITLYGQVQSREFLLVSAAEKKIVWRISGTGQPAIAVTRPDGTQSRLSWGPEFHFSSNYPRPGDEYGTALVLDAPGCWNIKFTRNSQMAEVWLQVADGRR